MSKAGEKRENEERLKRKREEELAATKKIEQRELELAERETQIKIDIDAGNALLKEGKMKLEQIMKEKDIDRSSLQVAQIMIDTGTSKSEKALKELEKIIEKQKGLEKEKSSALRKVTSLGEKDDPKRHEQRHQSSSKIIKQDDK